MRESIGFKIGEVVREKVREVAGVRGSRGEEVGVIGKVRVVK